MAIDNKDIERLLAVAEAIASDVTAMRRALETQASGTKKAKASTSGSGVEAKSKNEREIEKSSKAQEKQLTKQKLSGLAIGLDAITKMSDPVNSRVIAGVETGLRASQFAAAIGGNAVAGAAGSQIAQAGVTAAFNLSGAGQALRGLKQAQGDLQSRVAGAADAGIIFSDDQLQAIASGEIQRQKVLQKQAGRARDAFDKAAVGSGLTSSDKTALDSERNKLLRQLVAEQKKSKSWAKKARG